MRPAAVWTCASAASARPASAPHCPCSRASSPGSASSPYSVPERRGELKFVLVTESPDGELMVRFVARSEETVDRVRAGLDRLLAELPAARVVTVNLQPEHKAVVEGERDVVLTRESSLPMRLGGGVAAACVRRASSRPTPRSRRSCTRRSPSWVDGIAPASVWDLYCGVGGFALHVAAPGRRVVGVETSREAIRSARASAAAAGPASRGVPRR